MPKVLVTGAGRIGSQYLVAILNRVGIRACHEHIYNYRLDLNEPDLLSVNDRWAETDFEVSWEAVPFLSWVTPDVTVWHQVRDPLLTLRCWARHALLCNDDGAMCMIRKFMPQCGEGSCFDRAVKYLHDWNMAIESSGSVAVRYRVESLDEDHLDTLLQTAGYKVDRNLIRLAVWGQSKQAGSCNHKPEDDVTWDEVLRESPECGPKLKEMAIRYGYRY